VCNMRRTCTCACVKSIYLQLACGRGLLGLSYLFPVWLPPSLPAGGRVYPPQPVDYGSVYASKSFEDLSGRRLWYGWVYEVRGQTSTHGTHVDTCTCA
jgi:hypothetical protein